MPEKEPSLADKFVADLPLWIKAVRSREGRKAAERAVTALRMDMRRAHRFAIDDDFCRYATRVSSTTPAEKLLYRLQYATLPYEVTWIEFDAHVKVMTMRDVHMPGAGPMHDIDEVAPRMGFLMHRLDETKWTCMIVADKVGAMPFIMPNVVSYFVSLDEYDFTRNMKRLPGSVPLDDLPSELHMQAKAALWGYGANKDGKPGFLETKKWSSGHTMMLPSFLMRHGDAGVSRTFTVTLRHMMGIEAGPSGLMALAQVVSLELSEFTGFMRWAITVLAMLNEVPVRSRHVQPAGNYTTRIGSRPYLGYHEIGLRLPKLKPVPYIERKLGASHKNRAHDVMQHWRTYLADHPCRREEHVWVYDYDNGYRLCERCESFSRLIHEHVRGDPSLGWVQKSYVMKKARDAPEPDK